MAEDFYLLASALTHPGAIRRHNEDTIGVADWLASGAMAEPVTLTRDLREPMVCLVADGLGGHAAGETASRYAAQRLCAAAAPASDPSAVAALLHEINAELFELMRSRPELYGMGTTVAGIRLDRKQALVFNVGDSRVYRIEGRTLVQLSTDDTPGPKLADGRTAALTTSRITQCLGGYDAADLCPHVLAEPIVREGRYLICSDGLSDLLTREALETQLQADDRPAVQGLFDAAMAAGGRDNISIILLSLRAGCP